MSLQGEPRRTQRIAKRRFVIRAFLDSGLFALLAVFAVYFLSFGIEQSSSTSLPLSSQTRSWQLLRSATAPSRECSVSESETDFSRRRSVKQMRRGASAR